MDTPIINKSGGVVLQAEDGVNTPFHPIAIGRVSWPVGGFRLFTNRIEINGRYPQGNLLPSSITLTIPFSDISNLYRRGSWIGITHHNPSLPKIILFTCFFPGSFEKKVKQLSAQNNLPLVFGPAPSTPTPSKVLAGIAITFIIVILVFILLVVFATFFR